MLLRQAGIEPLTISPDVDEEAVVAKAQAFANRTLSPAEQVQLLAQEKARAVVARVLRERPRFKGLVIGGDSMFFFDGTIYGKPHTPEAATERWLQMRGRTGILLSGHCVIRVEGGRIVGEEEAVAEASVTFASDITDAEIAAYVATEEPLFVAGAFTVDSLGGPFISRIKGDPSTVVGMSLSTLRRLAMQLDVAWPSLWNRVEHS